MPMLLSRCGNRNGSQRACTGARSLNGALVSFSTCRPSAPPAAARMSRMQLLARYGVELYWLLRANVGAGCGEERPIAPDLPATYFTAKQTATGMKLPGMGGSMLLGRSRVGVRTSAMGVPFAAQQAMNMSSGNQLPEWNLAWRSHLIVGANLPERHGFASLPQLPRCSPAPPSTRCCWASTASGAARPPWTSRTRQWTTACCLPSWPLATSALLWARESPHFLRSQPCAPHLPTLDDTAHGVSWAWVNTRARTRLPIT